MMTELAIILVLVGGGGGENDEEGEGKGKQASLSTHHQFLVDVVVDIDVVGDHVDWDAEVLWLFEFPLIVVAGV